MACGLCWVCLSTPPALPLHDVQSDGPHHYPCPMLCSVTKARVVITLCSIMFVSVHQVIVSRIKNICSCSHNCRVHLIILSKSILIYHNFYNIESEPMLLPAPVSVDVLESAG
jgi:hypothetical protein